MTRSHGKSRRKPERCTARIRYNRQETYHREKEPDMTDENIENGTPSEPAPIGRPDAFKELAENIDKFATAIAEASDGAEGNAFEKLIEDSAKEGGK